MSTSCICWVFFLLSSLTREADSSTDQDCRHLEFRTELSLNGKRLANRVIKSIEVVDQELCGSLCFMEPNCASYNFKISASPSGDHRCELNNATLEGHEDELEENPNYLYLGAKSACLINPCKNNATCQTGYTDKGYRCFCADGFTGETCENDINECSIATHKCSVDAVCSNTKGSYNCTCKPGFSGDGHDCQDIDECTTETHECRVYEMCNNTKGSHNCTRLPCEILYHRNLSKTSILGHQQVLVECFLLNETGLGACGDGIWKLVMKIDGTKRDFHYSSSLWSNQETFNITGGKTGLDKAQTKLQSYWNTSFAKICLGMKIHGHEKRNFAVINKMAVSLHSLIADGQYRNTTLGRDTWKSLIGSEASLQHKCNKEGFNVEWTQTSNLLRAARIGILGNNDDDCVTCDSRIGFGTAGGPNDSNTCGNEATAGGDNGDRHIKAMGYILVQ